MYRTQITDTLRDALLPIGVTHIQLWNEDIQFLTEGQPFPTPAVFIEFQPIQWQQSKEGIYTNDAQLRLHVITSADSPGTRFLLATQLRQAVTRLRGQNFSRLIPFADETNHNHAELIEDNYTFTLKIWL